MLDGAWRMVDDGWWILHDVCRGCGYSRSARCQHHSVRLRRDAVAAMAMLDTQALRLALAIDCFGTVDTRRSRASCQVD